MARKALSKKTRFEVFKRDSFQCQYCGARAPETILEADHIKPVAVGGSDDIINLITSCHDCNSGKGARELGDDQVVSRQHDQLAELEERRQQLEMLMQWRDELHSLGETTIDAIAQRIAERSGYGPNQDGRNRIRRWLKKHALDDVVAATDEAFDAYLQWRENEVDAESWELAFRKIPSFISIREQEREKPYIRRLLYIQGIIRRRSKIRYYKCVDYLEHLHLCGLSLDELEDRAKAMRDLSDLEGPLDEWLNKIGRPF